MARVSETILITVTGADATTQTYPVIVDTVSGEYVSNPLSVPIPGATAGTSTVVATMPSHAGVAPSNSLDIVWQQTNGLVANGPVYAFTYTNPSMVRGWPGFIGTVQDNAVLNSLVFNQVVPNYPINGFTDTLPGLSAYSDYSPTPDGGGYKLNPMMAVIQNASGGYSSYTPINGTGGNPASGNYPGFVLDIWSAFIVKTAGWYTFYVNYANVSSFAVWIGNSISGGGGTVTFASQNYNGGNGANPFPTTNPSSAGHGWYTCSLAIVSTNNSAVAHPNVVSSYVYFSQPGIYPMEAVYNQYLSIQPRYDNNGYFQITYASGQANQNVGQGTSNNIGTQPFPVTALATNPTGPAPTGALRLTNADGSVGGIQGIQIQGATDTLHLSIQDIVYTTIPYIPLLEGTAGDLRLYDSGSVFNFGGATYGGASPDYTSAISAGAVNISGDNTAWQGLLSVASVGTSPTGYLKLAYNGAQFPFTSIDVTNLTITAEDIAWFNNTDKSYDLYVPSASGGGLTYPIQIAYMVKPPSLASLSPSRTTMMADGSSQPITITLPQPMSPEQQGLYGTGNTISATASASGGVTVSTPVAVLNPSGWLTGWQMNCTVPHSSTNGSFQLSMNATGTLTYLNGETFVVNGAVTYFNGVVATITTTGFSYTTPSNYLFTVTGGVSGTTITGSITMTAIIFSTDNGTFTTNEFFYIHGTTKVNVGVGTVTAGPTPVSGGYHTTVAITVTSAYAWGTPLSLGYTATDSLSGIPFTYTSSVSYTNGNPNPGGGGGGGCPAVEMWLSDSMQVCDCTVGASVDALIDAKNCHINLPLTEPAEVMSLDYSTEVCYRLKAENGAEVVVSESTPVPTFETIEAVAGGADVADMAVYASQVRSGMRVLTNVGNGVEWSMLTETECVGMRRVARLYCGGHNFAAGVKPGKYVYTHNLLEAPIVK